MSFSCSEGATGRGHTKRGAHRSAAPEAPQLMTAEPQMRFQFQYARSFRPGQARPGHPSLFGLLRGRRCFCPDASDAARGARGGGGSSPGRSADHLVGGAPVRSDWWLCLMTIDVCTALLHYGGKACREGCRGQLVQQPARPGNEGNEGLACCLG
jgi:hypothetical protein